jgi:peptidoglycan/LPS O-acetylase OafA/YrhL
LHTTKRHFEILDGLRGIAALGVVIFHFLEWVYPDPGNNFIGHGFLAVDFFFCLSGFVIGYAYDDRIKKIGRREFFRSRIIRLHPLVILGSVLGLATFLLDQDPATHYSATRVLLIFISSMLLIPFPVMPDRAFNLFGFNAPAWSLFWEYIANIVYALILSRIGIRLLRVLTLLAALGLCFVAHEKTNIMGGWSGPTFWEGSARIAWSFLAGLLIYRSGWIIKNKLGFITLSILLFLTFIMPFSKWNWLTEPAVVLAGYPLLISLGAGATTTATVKKIGGLFGSISYPLYMTHYAVIWIWGSYYTKHKPGTSQLFLIITPAIIALLGLAYITMKEYDIPVRKWLRREP